MRSKWKKKQTLLLDTLRPRPMVWSLSLRVTVGQAAGSTLEGTDEDMVRLQQQQELVWKEGKLTATFRIGWNNQ